MLIRNLSTGLYQLVTLQGSEQITLAELAARQRTGQTKEKGEQTPTLVLPASLCCYRQIAYASHEKKHLPKLIPYALEEDLVDKVDDLHFVIRPIPDFLAGDSPVAGVCYLESSVLSKCLDPFTQQGLSPEACLTELHLLPWQSGQWTVAFNDLGECLVRVSVNEGLACSPDNLEKVLQVLVREKGQPDGLLIVQDTTADITPLANWLEGIDDSKVKYLSGSYGELLLQSLNERNAGKAGSSESFQIDLLSGEFAPQLPWGKWGQQWRIAAVLLLAIGLLDLGARILETNKLEQLNQQLVEESEAVFRRAIPDGAMVDPLVQLQRRLAALRGNSDSGFVALLNKAAPVLMNNTDLEVSNLNYSENSSEIQMTMITRDFTTAEAIRTRLQSLGLQAELTGSTSSAEGNRSNLSITGRGLSG